MNTTDPLRRFASVGVINTAAGLGFICNARAAGLGEVPANAVGHAFGLVLSFTLNRNWTFRRRGRLLHDVPRFLSVMFVAWLANLAVLIGLVRCGVAPVLAQTFAVAPYVFVAYIGFRRWAFGTRPGLTEGGVS